MSSNLIPLYWSCTWSWSSIRPDWFKNLRKVGLLDVHRFFIRIIFIIFTTLIFWGTVFIEKGRDDIFWADYLMQIKEDEKIFKLIISGRMSSKFARFEFENKNHPGSGLSYVVFIKESVYVRWKGKRYHVPFAVFGDRRGCLFFP